MYKFGHKHETRGPDYNPDGTRVRGIQIYDVTVAKRWFDLLIPLIRKPIHIYVGESFDCRYTTEKFYPYQADRAILTIDGEDLFERLDTMAIRGKIGVHVVVPHDVHGANHIYMKHQRCVVRLSFRHKKSAMMAKLALG